MGVFEVTFLFLRAMLVRRLKLAAENLALRQQVAVLVLTRNLVERLTPVSASYLR